MEDKLKEKEKEKETQILIEDGTMAAFGLINSSETKIDDKFKIKEDNK